MNMPFPDGSLKSFNVLAVYFLDFSSNAWCNNDQNRMLKIKLWLMHTSCDQNIETPETRKCCKDFRTSILQ